MVSILLYTFFFTQCLQVNYSLNDNDGSVEESSSLTTTYDKLAPLRTHTGWRYPETTMDDIINDIWSPDLNDIWPNQTDSREIIMPSTQQETPKPDQPIEKSQQQSPNNWGKIFKSLKSPREWTDYVEYPLSEHKKTWAQLCYSLWKYSKSIPKYKCYTKFFPMPTLYRISITETDPQMSLNADILKCECSAWYTRKKDKKEYKPFFVYKLKNSMYFILENHNREHPFELTIVDIRKGTFELIQS